MSRTRERVERNATSASGSAPLRPDLVAERLDIAGRFLRVVDRELLRDAVDRWRVVEDLLDVARDLRLLRVADVESSIRDALGPRLTELGIVDFVPDVVASDRDGSLAGEVLRARAASLEAERVRREAEAAAAPATATTDADTHKALAMVCVSDVAPELVSWAWARRVPLAKLSMFDGDPGLGKSTLLAHAAARWTTGESLPGETVGREPFNVLLVSAEDGVGDTIRPRLQVAGADLARVFVVRGLPTFPGDLPRLAATIRKTSARAVVLDPGLAFLDPELNSHADAEARQYVAGLAEVAAETGAAVVFVRHLNKAASAMALYRGGGSIAFIATARSALLVARDPSDPRRRVLAAVKSNLCALPDTLVFRLVADGPDAPARIEWEGEVAVSAAEALAAALGPRLAAGNARVLHAVDLLRGILKDGPVPATDVAKALTAAGIGGDDPLNSYPVRRARRVLKVRSVKEGWNTWSWTLPAEGDTPPPSGASSRLRGDDEGDTPSRLRRDATGAPSAESTTYTKARDVSPSGVAFAHPSPAAATEGGEARSAIGARAFVDGVAFGPPDTSRTAAPGPRPSDVDLGWGDEADLEPVEIP